MHVPLVNGHADLDRNQAVIDGQNVRLSPNESKLFRYLAQRPGQTIDHEELLREVFGYAATVKSRTVITTMQRLRKKVEADPAEPVHLQNVYGRGYRFEAFGEDDRLIGRTAQLAELRRRLAQGSVWLVAPGGYGKSALAQRYAALVGDTVWVDLTEVRSEEALLAAVAHALGLPHVDDVDSLGLALEHRAPRLLVLDAAEHLGDQLAPFVGDWSTVAPVLVTSRLPVADRPSLELGPLAPDDAERLFVRCIPRAIPPEQLQPLLRGLQGVPLALELAGAQLAHFSPADLNDHLDDLLLLLTGGAGRQTSMRTVLEWSWERTPEALRQAGGALTPGRGGLAVADAVALLGADGLSLLPRLAGWGWILRHDGRVRMLDPVRQFVESVTDVGAARDRHSARFYEQILDREDDIVAGRSIPFVRREWGNLRAAFEHGIAAADSRAAELALALSTVMSERATTREALAMLDQATAVASGPLLGELLVARSKLWTDRGSTDAAELDLKRAADVGVRRPALAKLRWAKLHEKRGAWKLSEDAFREAVATLEGPQTLNAQIGLAQTLMDSGRAAAALPLLLEAVARSRVEQAPRTLQYALGTLGFVYTALDRFDDAQRACEDALEVCEAFDNLGNASRVHNNLGNIHLYGGNPERAAHHWTLCRDLSRQLGSRVNAALAEVNLSQLQIVARDLEAAESGLQSALVAFERAGLQPAAAFTHLALGRIAALREDWDETERHFARCNALPATLAWMLGVERSAALAAQGDAEGARRALESGPPGVDAGGKAGRRVAEGFWRAAAMGRDREADREHRTAIDVALHALHDVPPDPVLTDLVERLRERLGRHWHRSAR